MCLTLFVNKENVQDRKVSILDSWMNLDFLLSDYLSYLGVLLDQCEKISLSSKTLLSGKLSSILCF